MKIIKILILFIALVGLLSSCAEPKTFKDKSGKEFTAKPFGWANENSQKFDTVIYEINPGNIIISLIFSEIIIVPIYLTGWELYEPVRLKNQNELNQNTNSTELLLLCIVIGIIVLTWFHEKLF